MEDPVTLVDVVKKLALVRAVVIQRDGALRTERRPTGAALAPLG